MLTLLFPCFQNLALSRSDVIGCLRESTSLAGSDDNNFLTANKEEINTLLYLFSMSSGSVLL